MLGEKSRVRIFHLPWCPENHRTWRQVDKEVALALFSSLHLWVEGVPSINTKILKIRPDVLAEAPGILTLCDLAALRKMEACRRCSWEEFII